MIRKSEIIWNVFASGIAAILSAVLLMFCTRINGTSIAGMFSIAFATSVILNAVGDYGIRLYQVTDTKRKYSFQEYLALRVIVVIIMFAIGLIFTLISGYEIEKLLICMFLILYRVVDNLSETYQGEFQLQGKLDIGSMSVVLRYIASMIVFLIIDIITKNIVLSTVGLFATNMLIFILFDTKKIRKYVTEKPKFDKEIIKKLLKECLPVCISTLLSLYITNSVKYAIDLNGNYDMQTYYNIIFLPTFTINLASLFIIKPLLKVFGEYWNQNKIKELTTLIVKNVLLIVAVTVFIEAICATIAIPILNFIYGVQLDIYKAELIILVLSGCFYAISVLMLYSLTTVRKQRATTAIYVVISVLAFVLSNVFVKNMGMMGTALCNVIITFILALALMGLYIKAIYDRKREESNEK